MQITTNDLMQTGLFGEDQGEIVEPYVLSIITSSRNSSREFISKSKQPVFSQHVIQPEYFFILLRGIARLERSDFAGEERHMAFRMPGEQFGMTPAISGAPHEGSTYALTDLEVLKIGTNDFMCALQLSRPLLRKAICSLSNRFHAYAFLRDNLHRGIQKDDTYQSRMTEDNRRRLAGFLAEFHLCVELNKARGFQVDTLNLSLAQIARLIDVPISALNPSKQDKIGIMAEFESKGYIDIVNGRLKLSGNSGLMIDRYFGDEFYRIKREI